MSYATTRVLVAASRAAVGTALAYAGFAGIHLAVSGTTDSAAWPFVAGGFSTSLLFSLHTEAQRAARCAAALDAVHRREAAR